MEGAARWTGGPASKYSKGCHLGQGLTCKRIFEVQGDVLKRRKDEGRRRRGSRRKKML